MHQASVQQKAPQDQPLVREVLLYHATLREHLDSIRSDGCRSDVSGGQGQGSGLYVWASRAMAELHLRDVLAAEPNMTDGLIVTLRCPIEPRLMAPDCEVNAEAVVRFLGTHLERFKARDPSPIGLADGGRVMLPEAQICDEKANQPYRISFKIRQDSGSTRVKTFSGQDSNIGYAQILGPIIDRIRSTDFYGDDSIRAAYQALLDRITDAGGALRYVGTASLKADRIDCYSGGMWRPADDATLSSFDLTK